MHWRRCLQLLRLRGSKLLIDDPLRRPQYLHAARRRADFLINSGLWDEQFGGGFWCNTGHGDSPAGKPQTNALALRAEDSRADAAA
jgi:hypothetical protein